jgi:gamma-glutamyltranspeptidase/glutathione hydrolase
VTYPRAGNIGGGGFMTIHLADGRDTTIDYRETAPAAATSAMFLDAQGNPDPAKSRDSGLAVGVPGTVAGLALAQRKYGSGKLSLADLLAPAIRLAAQGFAVEDDLADSLPRAVARLARWRSSAGILLKDGGKPLQEGDRLIQSDLAATLKAIAEHGPQAFYQGEIAGKIAGAVRAAGGIMTADDLGNYRAVERAPVHGRYRGYDIVSMPPPSSGGVHLIEMLNILEGYDLGKMGRGDEALHYFIEAMKRAYADRATYMGDPDSVKMPVGGLLSKSYATALRAGIGARATPSSEVRPGNPADHEGRNTTHFSVIDRDGNAVSNTYTLNFSYGLGLIADGTGVLLNNELDDFTAKPGASNAYGLVGYTANLPGPGKRPLSSMTPTIVLKDGKPFLVTGSPGGSRIITAVLQVITNIIDFKMPVEDAVSAPRIHHQWQPDLTYVERGFPPAVLEALKARGHVLEPTAPHTSVNSILSVPATRSAPPAYAGAADPRTRGALAAGY